MHPAWHRGEILPMRRQRHDTHAWGLGSDSHNMRSGTEQWVPFRRPNRRHQASPLVRNWEHRLILHRARGPQYFCLGSLFSPAQGPFSDFAKPKHATGYRHAYCSGTCLHQVGDSVGAHVAGARLQHRHVRLNEGHATLLLWSRHNFSHAAIET